MLKQMRAVEREGERREAFVLLLMLLTVYTLIWIMIGRSPFQGSIYDSYALQASRWLEGHLDLGRTYSYLEIAEYNGRYFISFPPIPSVLLLPFCVLFGESPPDTLVAVALGLLGAVYALKMARMAGRRGAAAVFWAFFVTAGSNFLHVGFSADVWYFAQTASFAFTMISLCYAMDEEVKHGWAPLLFLALAFGCRPLQIVYLPLVVLLLLQKLRGQGVAPVQALKQYWWWLLPPLAVGSGLMALNAARFDDPFQFGHDYLPEFAVEKADGQFSLAYLAGNWARLWRLPGMENGRLRFPTFDGCAFWLFSPIFLVFAVYLLRNLRGLRREPAVPLTVGLILLQFAALCCHATMGGWQFGNRYTIDALPALYTALTLLQKRDESDLQPLAVPLCLWGVGLNLTGTVALFNGWLP